MDSSFQSYNIRSLLGSDSAFDVLQVGEFAVMNSIHERLVGGGSLEMTYDPLLRQQNRELHIPLVGVGSTSGRLEFEVEREHGGIKSEMTLKIRDAATGSHAFWIDHTFLGNVVVNTEGFGRLTWSTDPGSQELPFPDGVIAQPRLGSTIQIGDFFSATIGDGFDSTDGTVPTNQTRFALTGSNGLWGTVEYEVEPENLGIQREFKVDVRNATPFEQLDLFVDAIDVGDISVDARGRGVIRLSDNPNVGELPFPAAFPEIQVGTVVDIDHLLTGVFAAIPRTAPGGVPVDERELQGGLFGATGARGGTRYETQLEDGGFLERQFRVHVRNAVPGSVHDVRVNDVVVGQLLVESDGRGIVDLSNRMNDPRELAMPPSFPDVQPGAKVDVGVILTGVLAPQLANWSGVADNSLALYPNPLPFSQPVVGLASGMV